MVGIFTRLLSIYSGAVPSPSQSACCSGLMVSGSHRLLSQLARRRPGDRQHAACAVWAEGMGRATGTVAREGHLRERPCGPQVRAEPLSPALTCGGSGAHPLCPSRCSGPLSGLPDGKPPSPGSTENGLQRLLAQAELFPKKEIKQTSVQECQVRCAELTTPGGPQSQC